MLKHQTFYYFLHLKHRFHYFCVTLHSQTYDNSMLILDDLNSVGRINYIDWAKAVCIFLMVVGHYTDNTIILSYVYSFHMPAFFIISGFLYKPHPWKQTIIAFTVPVFFFSLLNLFINLILGRILVDSLRIWDVIVQIVNWRHGIDGLFKGLWFIWALVGLRLLFGDIGWMKKMRQYHVPIAIAIIIYMSTEKYHADIDTLFQGYYIGTIVPSLPFFCIGMLLKDRQWHPNSISSFKTMIPILLLFLVMPATNNNCDIYNSDYGYSYFLAAVNAAMFTFLLFWTSNKLPASKIIQTISNGTLVVLGMHMPLLYIFQIIFPDILSFLFPFITIAICYYIILLCEKYCPILLGKIKRK